MSGKYCLYDEWREEKDIVELANYKRASSVHLI